MTLLIVMAAMKLLEMRTQREVVLSIYLGFFLVMTNFLFSQSIPLGLYLLVVRVALRGDAGGLPPRGPHADAARAARARGRCSCCRRCR